MSPRGLEIVSADFKASFNSESNVLPTLLTIGASFLFADLTYGTKTGADTRGL